MQNLEERPWGDKYSAIHVFWSTNSPFSPAQLPLWLYRTETEKREPERAWKEDVVVPLGEPICTSGLLHVLITSLSSLSNQQQQQHNHVTNSYILIHVYQMSQTVYTPLISTVYWLFICSKMKTGTFNLT